MKVPNRYAPARRGPPRDAHRPCATPATAMSAAGTPVTRPTVAATLAALAVGVALVAGGVGEGFAHGGASGIVKERMDSMEAMGDHAKAVGDMLKGKRALEPEAVREAAASFVEHGERIPELFPDTEESRRGAKTEALPEIWEDWDGFSEIAARFVDDSRTLAAAAETLGDDAALDDPAARPIKAAFFRAAKNCSGCHERFRLDTD